MEKLKPFEQLNSNIKTHVSERLAPLTAWCGRNRSGKTSRIDAITLALTGKHAVGPHGVDLIELGVQNTPSLFAELSGPDGKTEWKLAIENGKAKKPGPPLRVGRIADLIKDEDLEHILPAQSMASLIRLGTPLTREAIFSRFGQLNDIRTPRGLNEDQLKLWAEGLKEVREADAKADTAEQLSALNAWMRRKKLALGKELNALEAIATKKEEAMAPAAAGAEQLPEWKKQLAVAEAWERASAARARKAAIDAATDSYRARGRPLIEEEKTLVANAAKHTELIKQLETDRATILSQVSAIEEQIKTETFYLAGGEWVTECLHRGIKAAEAAGTTTSPCLVCSNPDFEPAVALEQVLPRVEARKASIQALYKKKAQVEASAAEVTAKISALQSEQAAVHADFETRKAALRLEYAQLTAQREENALALVGAPATYEGPTSVELRSRIESVSVINTKQVAVDEDLIKVRQLKTARDTAKVLEEEAAKLLNQLLKQTADAAQAAVNKYMPAGFRAKLDTDSVAWTVIGTDGRAHPKGAMAASEKGSLLVALALAWTEGQAARFVILEEEETAGFEPETLRGVLDALRDAQADGLITQVFMTSFRPHELPDYIHKIWVGGVGLTEGEPAPAPVSVPAPRSDSALDLLGSTTTALDAATAAAPPPSASLADVTALL